MFKLHTINKHPKSTQRKKVVGRGRGSGHGKYSTRGGKGQTARTGHSKMPIGFEGGRQPLIRQLPKNRGFKSTSAKPVALRFDRVAKAYAEGEVVTLATLRQKNLVAASTTRVKLVGGKSVTKKLNIQVPASESVATAVKAAGGSVK